MKKLFVPAVVILMAVTSAFSTGDSSSKKSDIVSGFVKHNLAGTNCQQEDDCSSEDTGTLCYINQNPTQPQLWIMNENEECLVQGYRPE